MYFSGYPPGIIAEDTTGRIGICLGGTMATDAYEALPGRDLAFFEDFGFISEGEITLVWRH